MTYLRVARPLAVAVALTVSCSQNKTPAPSGDSEAKGVASEPRPHFGSVMAEVGRRFELAGRAGLANRFELAAFEVGEIGELFEGELPRAELPKEGPTAHIPVLAKAFLEVYPAELEKAAKARDAKAFAAAFQRTSVACNACHQASEKKFVEIPSLPGQNVPSIEPLPQP